MIDIITPSTKVFISSMHCLCIIIAYIRGRIAFITSIIVLVVAFYSALLLMKMSVMLVVLVIEYRAPWTFMMYIWEILLDDPEHKHSLKLEPQASKPQTKTPKPKKKKKNLV